MTNPESPLVVELLVNEDDHTGVDLISFVALPAIERDFMYFNTENIKLKRVDDEQRLVVGLAMVPDENILRYDKQGNPYFVFFTTETIKKCSEMYFQNSKQNGSNLEHEVPVGDVTVVESWLIVDVECDKAKALGLPNLKAGSWVVTYKVNNDELWGMVKAGEVRGFSIQGPFMQKYSQVRDPLEMITELLKSDKPEDEKVEALKKILNKNK